MNFEIITKTYEEPPYNVKEILRYSGCKTANNEILNLIDSCIAESKKIISYKVCYCFLPLDISGEKCDFTVFKVNSKNLAFNLQGSKEVLLFAATVGVGVDRLINKYGRISPSKALIFQAIGAERIEALCDIFCADISKEKGVLLKPRFSPGYGDLPIEVQQDVFSVLNCGKKIGLYLNESMLMSPSKSVTAFAGIKKDNS